ncbi:hypothetical protein APY03_3120 [Variovorax sp. WDL1]|nr:hypothetical protein APY03_3120 [Variovorax sp. WDL1]
MRATGSFPLHTGSAIGRHCHSSRASAALAANTKVLRSTGSGTNRVHPA